jgi:hypothetical protein
LQFSHLKLFKGFTLRVAGVALIAIAVLSAAGCGNGGGPVDETGRWSVVDTGLPAALISIWGTGSDDIWAVGADPKDGTGPLVFHNDGTSWSRIQTGRTGDLWWVFGFPEGPVFLGGQNGMILRREGDRLDLMETPGRGTVFGIWGTAPDDLWAVGGNVADGAFVWRYDGERWHEAEGFPADLADAHSMFKVWGRSADDVWVIGTGGVALRFQGEVVTRTATNTARSLFTVHGNSVVTVAVGGSGDAGRLLQHDGEEWSDVTPEGTPHIIGVRMTQDVGYAVGVRGTVARWDGKTWKRVETGIALSEAFHTVWIDPDGGVWAVGGRVVEPPLVDGVMVYRSP